jgi:competence ComEA-like helix-hairpin-helix protein
MATARFNRRRQRRRKALLERTCTKCHKLARPWASAIARALVRHRGRHDCPRRAATDPEIEASGLPGKNFGPKVNVNKATVDQLAATLEVPKAAASAIVEYREKNGSFKSFEDLRKVPAIDWSSIESKKDRLDFSEGK